MFRTSARVGVIGCGKYIPQNIVTNETLAKNHNLTSDWIEKRTGIKTRYYANSRENPSFIATQAARNALQAANKKSEDVSLIICCSYSGEYIFPPLACKVQSLLQARRAGAFDLSAGSAGFEIAMATAGHYLCYDLDLDSVLVIGVSVQSPFINEKDVNTSIIFGDAAAAALLARVPDGYGLLATEIFSDGNAFEAVRLRRSGGRIEMNGIAVGKQYLKHQPAVIEKALKKAGLKMEDVDLFLFHQANLRMIQLLMAKMQLAMTKTFTNVEQYGNTSDASVLLVLCEAAERGRIKRDDYVVLSGVGPGFVFAASVLKWH